MQLKNRRDDLVLRKNDNIPILTQTAVCFHGQRISGFVENIISIADTNFVSNLQYSENYELSFEYKASTVPSNGNWHQILLGNLSSL